jgi:hypothetical protein
MSKYCLKVWNYEFDGEPVEKDGEPVEKDGAFFVGSFPEVYTYKADMELANPNATYKIFHWNNIGGIGEELMDAEDQEHIIKRKGDKVTIKVGSGYVQGVDKLATIKDNGNGYHVCFPSSTSTQQMYI